MVERRTPIQIEEAFRRIIQYAKKGMIESVPIEQSLGRFLGEDLIADHAVPPFDRSPYDGYAVRAEDTKFANKERPIALKVVGTIGAGEVFKGAVGANEAVRIMTGAKIPERADAVIMLEATKNLVKDGTPFIEVIKPIQAGENISFTGEDTKKGSVLVQKGTYIHPGVVACLATFGYKHVPVGKKPRVGIIATGSELLELDDPIEEGKIRNSNAYMIQSQIARAGGDPIYFGQFSDDVGTCFQIVERVLEEVDFLITTGGVSVGDYDYLPEIYKKLGAKVLFNKIGMRPGSVTTVAEKDGKLLFGLSGNPSACYVGFELFTRPLLRAYLHADEPFLKKEWAKLGVDVPKANPFDRFVRGRLSFEKGELIATPVGLDKSNVVTSLAQANVLIQFPRGTKGLKKGQKIPILMFEEMNGMSFQSFINF